MEKFTIDLSEIQNIIDANDQTNRLPVEGNEHRMIRVAFDFFRLKGDEADDLWQVQSSDDGEFLVRTYSLPDEEEDRAKTSSWSVFADKDCANLTIAYQGVPITRLAAEDYGAETPEDGKILQGILFNRLSTDSNFVQNLIASLPESKREAFKTILSKYSDYQEYFETKMEAAGVSDPSEIPEEQRKEFWEEVDEGWEAEQEADGPLLMEQKVEQWKQMSPKDKSLVIPGWEEMTYRQLMGEVGKLPVVTPGEVKVTPTARQEKWMQEQERRRKEIARQWAEKVKRQRAMKEMMKSVRTTDPLGGLEAEPFKADDVDPVLAAMEERMRKQAEEETCPQCKKDLEECKCENVFWNICPECVEPWWKCKCRCDKCRKPYRDCRCYKMM